MLRAGLTTENVLATRQETLTRFAISSLGDEMEYIVTRRGPPIGSIDPDRQSRGDRQGEESEKGRRHPRDLTRVLSWSIIQIYI